MLTGNLQLEWELPSKLSQLPEGQDIREYMSASPALTLKDGVVHFGCCKHQVAKLYGFVGSHILEGVICAVENPLGLHGKISNSNISYLVSAKLYHWSEDSEFAITVLPNLLECSYATMDPEFLSTLKGTLSWICLLKHIVIRHHIALSKGYWVADTFHLHPIEVIDWSNQSWTQTVGHAIVASLDDSVQQAPLLSTTFPLAHQLAGVHAPIWVDEGLIFHGGMTALVPIELCDDGTVLWHFEGRLDDLLNVADIECIKTGWF